MSRLFEQTDAFGEPTLWLDKGDDRPVNVLRRSDLSPATYHLWDTIVDRFVGEVSA
jgi:hypothetical protein